MAKRTGKGRTPTRTATPTRRAKGANALRKRTGSYDGASRGRLFLKWNPDGNGPNTSLVAGLRQMRNRSRDLGRNNPWVISALDSLVSNVTDPGIKPISRASDLNFRKEVRTLWDDWCYEADAAGLLSFDLLVGLAYRAMLESGEVFLRIRKRRAEDGLVVPLQVQIIEADHCPIETTVTPANKNNKIIAGIEFDPLGRRVAYWMYPEHPGESADYQQSRQILPVRIPADEIVHLFDPTRPGQIRGVPKMAAILTRMRDLSEYEAAELVKKKIASLFVGAITSPNPEQDFLDEEEGLDEQDDVTWGKLEPGTVMSLAPGEEMNFNDPPASDGTYEPHVKMQLRATASALGLTYEMMTGDLTGVNFSSIRAGLNEFQRRARRSQRILIHQLMERVWRVWLEQAVIAGAIDAPEYATKTREYRWVEWRAPGWRYVNPQQEIAAVKEEIKAGLKSRQQVAAEQGMDISEIDEQIAEDKARAESLGLKFDTDADGTQNDTSAQSVTESVQVTDDTGEEVPVPAADDEAEEARALIEIGKAVRKSIGVDRARDEKTKQEIDALMAGVDV